MQQNHCIDKANDSPINDYSSHHHGVTPLQYLKLNLAVVTINSHIFTEYNYLNLNIITTSAVK